MTTRLASTLLVSAWALFITIVAASNLTELLHGMGVWSPTFRSGNLGFIATATSIYGVSHAMNVLLLAGAMAWEATAAILLWRAAARLRSHAIDAPASARLGLIVLALLWFAFAIATELLIAYDRGVDESMYWTLATAAISTLVVVQMLERET